MWLTNTFMLAISSLLPSIENIDKIIVIVLKLHIIYYQKGSFWHGPRKLMDRPIKKNVSATSRVFTEHIPTHCVLGGRKFVFYRAQLLKKCRYFINYLCTILFELLETSLWYIIKISIHIKWCRWYG